MAPSPSGASSAAITPVASPSDESPTFSPAQKEYLEGFLRGTATADAVREQAADPNESPLPEPPGFAAQRAWLAAGKRLSKEEQIKHEGDPLDAWDRIVDHSMKAELPAGADVFRFKFHGLFNVSPAQEAMMCRLRFPGGALTASQLEAVAEASLRYGGGYADLTTRANLQIREIAPAGMAALLMDLHDAGVVPRGSGADNVRNVTGSPTAGFDPDELYDVLPLCRRMHHHILHDRTLYGLPRKFNIAFDGGGMVAALEDTNDIGFRAVRVDAARATEAAPAGVWFRLALGGITGHKDFARDTGVLLRPEECVPVADAILRVFIARGDRGNRGKARLKYVLDAMGFDAFLAETEKILGAPLRRFPLESCVSAPASVRDAHLGVRPQRQSGLCWVGARVSGARLTQEQLRGVAGIARTYGDGTLRLTVWQTLLVPNVSGKMAGECAEALRGLGLETEPDPVGSGLVACTGAEGCRYGLAPTKATAKAIEEHLADARRAGRIELDAPVNIHLTGCPHSCAQHFIGDLGLLATTVEHADGTVGGGFHLFVGGGFQDKARIAVPVRRSVSVAEVPATVEAVLRTYLAHREGAESFTAFAARHVDTELTDLFSDTDASPDTPATGPEAGVRTTFAGVTP